VGDGIGATHDGCDVRSPARAAGMPPMITVMEPLAMRPGPAGTQGGGPVHGIVMSVTRAAAIPPMSTLGAPLTMANGTGG
jgi:hypothetical protein